MARRIVQLNRKFWPVTKEPADDAVRRLRRIWGSHAELSWPDLLRLPCVVVLGEAGTGKTTELRAIAQELEASGRYAFFLPIEAVAARGVEKSLNVQGARSFRAWINSSSQEAWFFLDAVDESKLKGHAFSTALATFGQQLEPALAWTHLILSSRVSDWRSADEDEVLGLRRHLWPNAAAESEQRLLFELAPLTEAQIEALARSDGLTDTAAFLEAVKEANAWEFLERPLDVQWLVEYWNMHRTLGSLTDLVDFNINERLKERPDRSSVLSVTEARSGASKLALGAVLCHAWAFRLPGEAPDPHARDSLDPSDVLPDWSNERLADLLSRGVFDEATYGRVRIHHRSVQDFLAAEELRRMVMSGFPRDELEALLFRESAGQTVVPTNLIPVLAWYAGGDRSIIKRAIETIPQHLIDEGDPSRLAPEDRRQALRAYAKRFRDQERVFHHFDTFGLRRFAGADLAETVRELLTAAESPVHLKELLVEIVEAGRIAPLADIVHNIALAPDTPITLRVAAIEAMGTIGRESERNDLLTLIDQPCAREKDVAATLIGRLFPAYMPVERFVDLMRVVSPPGRGEATTFGLLLASDLARRCSPEQRLELIRLLSDEILVPGAAGGEPVRVRDDRVWLAELSADLLSKIINEGSTFTPLVDQGLLTLAACLEHGDYLSGERRIERIEKDAGLRRAFFWHRVQNFREREGRFPRMSWELRLDHGLHLGGEDTEWLEHDCVHRSDVRERRLAFMFLMNVFPRSGSTEDYWATMEAVATASDATHGTDALQKRVRRVRACNTNTGQHESPWALQAKVRERRTAKQHEQSVRALRRVIDQVRAGENFQALVYLHDNCAGHGALSKYEAVSIEALAETHGADIASAAREGFKNFWRRSETARVEAWEEANKVPYTAILGLAGVALDVEDGLDLAALSESLLREAIALAPWELNAFPAWLARCAKHHPAIVRQVFAPAIRCDYVRLAHDDGSGRLLSKLAHADPEVQVACEPELVQLLMHGDPPREDVLSDSLQVVQQVRRLTPDQCTSLAEARLSTLACEDKRFVHWLRLLLSCDPLAAVRRLESAIAHAKNADATIEALCVQLGSRYERRQEDWLAALRANPKALARLAILVRHHVRPADDISHKGMFFLGPRDDAQQFRDSLIGWLASMNDTAATSALEGLIARVGATGVERDWLRHLLSTRVVADASKPMTPQEAGALMRSVVLQPVSERELFTIAQNRLRDIERDVADGDFSIRQAFNAGDEPTLEEPVQNYVALELEHRRRSQYNVVREPEVTRKAKPDIRLHNSRWRGPITIEVKIAERWSLPELKAALADQLVGTYMRANNSNHGILVLCSSGKKRGWRAATGEALDFGQLVRHLSEDARQIVSETPSIVDVVVLPIDFH